MENGLMEVKRLLKSEKVEKRFNEILGAKSTQFMASITNAVSCNEGLQRCNPSSVLQAAFIAASFDLPIDSNLGFSAIVPYKGNAQFQMMYKGFVQLAIRTGLYEKMNNSEVYEDELVSYNPVMGEVKIVDDFSKCTQRAAGERDKIAGYYAWFKLKNGFSHELFMSKAEVHNHARKYSRSYQDDLARGRQSSRWSTDFDSMAKKTVIKLLLSKWAPLTVEMQKALQEDQKVYAADGSWTYDDNGMQEPDGERAVDAFAVVRDADGGPKPEQGAKAPALKQAPAGGAPAAIGKEDYEDYEEFDMKLDAILDGEELPFR